MGLDSPLHIILLLAIVLLIFGAKRLPEIGRSLGSGLRGFKESINEEPAADHARRGGRVVRRVACVRRGARTARAHGRAVGRRRRRPMLGPCAGAAAGRRSWCVTSA